VHPVVQEVMRLFDERILSVTLVGTSEGAEGLLLYFRALGGSSQV